MPERIYGIIAVRKTPENLHSTSRKKLETTGTLLDVPEGERTKLSEAGIEREFAGLSN